MNEKNPGCLGHIGDCTAQLYGDYNSYNNYNKPLYYNPYKTTSIMESKKGFFRGSGDEFEHFPPSFSNQPIPIRWAFLVAAVAARKSHGLGR